MLLKQELTNLRTLSRKNLDRILSSSKPYKLTEKEFIEVLTEIQEKSNQDKYLNLVVDLMEWYIQKDRLNLHKEYIKLVDSAVEDKSLCSKIKTYLELTKD